MSQSSSLSQIPVITVNSNSPGQKLHRRRRQLQAVTVLIAILIPLLGLFRIDVINGAFVVLDRQIDFGDFFIIIGFWLMISSALIITYSALGTAFCGWSCPQNTLSEWANYWHRRLLGKRSDMTLDGSPMQVSSGKNKLVNWLTLGAILMGFSMIVAIVPMLYFYPLDILWNFLTFRADERLSGSEYYIYFICVLLIFIDVAFMRHFFCRFVCVYKVWQHSFKTKETLHIVHDKSAEDECAKCNFCQTSCFVDIDPRQTQTYDACVNCGECITACESIRGSRKTGASLLSFEMGQVEENKNQPRNAMMNLRSRLFWIVPLVALGAGMFAWGMVHYEPYRFSVYHSDTAQGREINEYRISLAHKFYKPAEVSVEIDGLPAGSYDLRSDVIQFTTAQRQDVKFTINNDLEPGLYPFLVRVKSNDGWQDSFRVHHVAVKDNG